MPRGRSLPRGRPPPWIATPPPPPPAPAADCAGAAAGHPAPLDRRPGPGAGLFGGRLFRTGPRGGGGHPVGALRAAGAVRGWAWMRLAPDAGAAGETTPGRHQMSTVKRMPPPAHPPSACAAACPARLQRGKTPIVVGGTGFYLRWFIHGRPATPASTPASEAAASARLEQVRLGLGCLFSVRVSLGSGCGCWGGGAWGVSQPLQALPLTPRCALQAYAEAAAAAGCTPGDLPAEQRWAAACALVEALGDGASAERLRGEPNNQYRLLRVVDILLQSGKPLAGGWGCRQRCCHRISAAWGAGRVLLQRPGSPLHHACGTPVAHPPCLPCQLSFSPSCTRPGPGRRPPHRLRRPRLFSAPPS